jgi:outer membrane protein
VKNISGILNVVLLVAVAGLYYLHFTKGSSEEMAVSSEGLMVDNPTIVYVNSDSLLVNYEYIKDQQEALKAKSEKLNAEFTNRAKGLQTEINNYQKNGNNMTIGQARAVEEDLMKKQQNLKLYEQSLGQQLINEEGKINQELYNKVSTFLKQYGEDNEFHMVVKYNPGSDILYANGGMDITTAVIDGLNTEYENSTVAVDSTASN